MGEFGVVPRIVWTFRRVTIRFDGVWKEVIREVSVELGYRESDVELLLEMYWRWVMEMLGHPEMPEVRMMYFGKFCVKNGVLRNYCDRMAEALQDLHGRLLRGEVKKSRIGDLDKIEYHLDRLQDTWIRIDGERECRKERMLGWKNMKRKNKKI